MKAGESSFSCQFTMDYPTDERRRPQPEEGPLHIVYEDDWILALDKPAGLVVHPTYKNTSGTLLNAVLWHVRQRDGAQPGILTRLDKHTSGLVLIALRPDVHASMQRDAATGRTRKEYLAIVRGVPSPPRGRVVLPLARDAADRRRVVVTPGGQHSETEYEVLRKVGHPSAAATHGIDDLSLVKCVPITGRTHQIRVHLASSGWPIVGDAVYGQAHPGITRQALHAWRVELLHPATRQPLTLEAPIPEDMRGLLA